MSGARVGYLCAAAATIDALRAHNPPWSVSTIGQAAGVAALEDTPYSEAQWWMTHALRWEFSSGLEQLGVTIVPGVANFLLCARSPEGPTARALTEASRARGLFLREVDGKGRALAPYALRIAVKEHATNMRMLNILASIL